MRSALVLSLFLAVVLAACATEEEAPQTPEPVAEVPYLNSENFDEEVYESAIPVLVDFTATWCIPCRAVDPIIESLYPEMEGRAKIRKVDIDESPDIYQGLRVNGVPTVVFFKDGVEQDRVKNPQSREIYVRYLEAMISGGSALDATLALLDDDDFRRQFLLSREVEAVEEALQRRPDLLQPFENGQTALSLILNRPSVRQNALVDMALSQDPVILPRELVGLGRCDELKSAIAEDPELASRPDPDGAVPLYVALLRAARLENGGCLRTLLDGGADPSRDQDERHFLTWALMVKQDVGLLEDFLDRGLDPEATNSEGMNALHLAIVYAEVDSARLLLERGADAAAKTAQGQTAADMARERREINVAKLEESESEEMRAYRSERIKTYDGLLALLEGAQG